MQTLTRQLWQDDAGFIASGELILIATILVIGLVVGLSEISWNLNQELEDVGSAFGSVNQSYRYSGSDYQNQTPGGNDILGDLAPQAER